MDYKKHYDLLIKRAKNRILPEDIYTEKHHILPKCLGGGDWQVNLVRLTPEEHYLAHQLLVKMHPNDKNLACAVVRMSGGNTGNKAYGWIRRKVAEATRDRLKGVPLSEEHKSAMRVAAKNRKKAPPVSEETKQKMSESARNKVFTESHKKNLSIARAGRKPALGLVHSEDSKKLMGAPHAGKPKSEEQRLKMAAARKAWWDKKKKESL